MGPVSGLRQVAVGDPDAGFHRRNGTYVREPRPVALLGLVQQGYGLLPVALGMGDQSHRHEPPVAALGHRRSFTEGRGPLEVSIGGLKVPDFVVHLAESHVQVGGWPAGRGRRAPRSPPVLAGGAGVPCWGDLPRATCPRAPRCWSARRPGCRPRGRLATACVNVPLRPRDKAEEPGRTASRDLVGGADQVERVPSVFRARSTSANRWWQRNCY